MPLGIRADQSTLLVQAVRQGHEDGGLKEKAGNVVFTVTRNTAHPRAMLVVF